MKELYFVILVSVSFLEAFAQDIVLKNQNGQIVDTLDDRSLYTIKNDTLTRFRLGKSFSPDHCSSFSILRDVYIRERSGFRQIRAKKIVVGSKCSSLMNADDAYCLRLTDFKFSKGTVKISIEDSNDRKLKIRLKGRDDFEDQLKDKLDKFIGSPDCNGVRIE